ncbi:MAG: aminopeptidase [Burkholderiaceae bacterium]|nr:aminopeptidase [Burkholderiaceae bacterium]
MLSSLKRLMPTTLGGRLAVLMLLAIAALATAGCSTVGYYTQAAQGHLSLMAAARPIDDWLADPATAEPLKRKLEAARQMRAFASRELGLPDNRSYTAYADLKRPAVVWNVFATQALSVQLKTWCYPMFGCAGYRGYFDQADANRTADTLRAQGYDVNVGAVPAYSTLGWTNWLGGDPLLNTFIHWSDAELARLIFHELAHQVLYVKDDTVFNESFATAVERVGVRRWLQAHGDEAQQRAYAQVEQRRNDFVALLVAHRAKLVEAFADDAPAEVKRERKRAVFASLQSAYRQMRDARWGGFAGYDRFFAQDLNNAHLAAVGAYNELVPAFEALLAREGGDLPRFYDAVRALAARPRAERDAALRALAPAPTMSSIAR